MQLLKPAADTVAAAQAGVGRFYFSGAAELILAKHGVVSGSSGAVLATRGTPWPGETGRCGLFEGPVHPTVLTQTGLTATTERARSLHIYHADGTWLCDLRLNRPQLRRIPTVGSKTPSLPYDWAPADPRWLPADFEWQALDGSGTPVLLADAGDGERRVVGRRVGDRVVLGIPLLDLAVQHHAAPPYEAGYMSMRDSSDLEAAERFLLDTAVELDAASGIPSVRLAAWPHPFRSALTIRHDFDRRMDGLTPGAIRLRQGVDRLLEGYRRHGLRSTWFWRVFSFNAALIGKVAQAGHEVALHTDTPGGSRSEIEAEIAFFTERGVGLRGLTAHGGAGSIGYVGTEQLAAALAHGMAYGELAGSNTTLPAFAFALHDDAPRVARLVVPAQHLSLDKTTKPEDHWLEDVLMRAGEVLGLGGHAVVMNHPDIHVDQMLEFCARVPKTDVWPATMLDVASWFRSSRSARLAAACADAAEIVFDEAPTMPVALCCRSAGWVWRLAAPAGARSLRLVLDAADLAWRAADVDGGTMAEGRIKSEAGPGRQ